MTISFFEPGDVPQPPDEVKIEHFVANVYPDRQRVKVELHVTPFQERPSLEIKLFRQENNKQQAIATASVVETMHPRMEFTLHIRGVDDPAGDYALHAMLYYREIAEQDNPELPAPEPQDEKEIMLTVPTAENQD
jgi:hypothetical protein